jgi:hypothetical protein
MDLSCEDKQYMLREFLKKISQISDRNYQIRVWIKGIGPECSDFSETVCWFFDLGDPILGKYKEFGINDHQYLLLSDFYKKFDAFSGENTWPPDFIDSLKWQEIMDEAKAVLAAFHYPQ